jgi:hypothetical protein
MICHRCGGELKLIPARNTRDKKNPWRLCLTGSEVLHAATGKPCCEQAYRKQSWTQKLDEPKQLEIAEIYGVIQI